MMHEVYTDIGTMLIDNKKTEKESKYYEQPPIAAQEEVSRSAEEVDYGLDRYQNIGNLDLEFDDSIEWSVDK